MNKFFIVLLGALVALMFFSACDSLPFVSQASATETPTRRAARPTFTPRAKATETAEVTATDEPTETDVPAQDQPTDVPTKAAATKAPTRRPVTAAPTKPPLPTAVPAPKFSVNATSQYMCSQDGIFEVVINSKRGKAYVETGLYFAAFDLSGKLLQDGAGKDLVGTVYPASQSTGSNCHQSASFDTPDVDNGKLSVGDAIRAGINPIIFRFIKSQTPLDLTPVSPDFKIDFGKGGRYWIYTQSQ